MTTRSEALKTDHYELTMLEAALHSGVANKPSVFEVFARKLPTGRRYGIVGGIGRIMEGIRNFKFTDSEIEFLEDRGFLNEETMDYLRNYSFGGTITSYQEGEVYFPYSPILTVESTFAEGVLLETLILSIINADSAVASAASRMIQAADGKPLIEMGSRRTHDAAAVSSARIATALGFTATSNLEAGRTWGAPTKGTSAHAFTLAHMAMSEDPNTAEKIAFKAQVEALGVDTTLLIDTFNIEQGIRNAIEVAGPTLGGIRIDSGDLVEEAKKARILLDSLGATETRIVVSSDLDEYSITELLEANAPIDVFGVGTRLVVGSGHPTASFVYKLVAIEDENGNMRSVAKNSDSKGSKGGKKTALRILEDGKVTKESVTVNPTSTINGRKLQHTIVLNGEVAPTPTLKDIRSTYNNAISELKTEHLSILAGETAFTGQE